MRASERPSLTRRTPGPQGGSDRHGHAQSGAYGAGGGEPAGRGMEPRQASRGGPQAHPPGEPEGPADGCQGPAGHPPRRAKARARPPPGAKRGACRQRGKAGPGERPRSPDGQSRTGGPGERNAPAWSGGGDQPMRPRRPPRRCSRAGRPRPARHRAWRSNDCGPRRNIGSQAMARHPVDPGDDRGNGCRMRFRYA